MCFGIKFLFSVFYLNIRRGKDRIRDSMEGKVGMVVFWFMWGCGGFRLLGCR